MATPTLTVRPLIPPSDALTFALNVSNALAAVFSLPPSPGTHPNAAAAPWTISPSGPRIPLTTKMRKAAFSVFHTVFHARDTAPRTVLTAVVIWPKCRVIHKIARPTGPVMMPRSSGQFRRTQFHTPMITATTAAASATHGSASMARPHALVAAAAMTSAAVAPSVTAANLTMPFHASLTQLNCCPIFTAASAYRATRTRSVFLDRDAITPDRGSSADSSSRELEKVDRPNMALPTLAITAPRLRRIATACGVSARNVAISEANPVWPDRVVPHTRNFAVILSSPDSRDCEVGRNAFRIPPMPTMTLPIARAILVIAGPVFFG